MRRSPGRHRKATPEGRGDQTATKRGVAYSDCAELQCKPLDDSETHLKDFVRAVFVSDSVDCASNYRLRGPNGKRGDSPECKEITARIIEETNAKFDHFSPSGDNVFLEHLGANSLVLSCTSHRLTGISINWDKSGYPPNAWFDLAAKAGKAVTGVDANSLVSALHKCHRAALKDSSELSDLEISNAKIECQAFTRDGGGVSMGVWINDHGARKGIEDPE